MRFVFVDRIVGLEPGRRIEVLKNVAASEDIFADHFPGCPIFPGALIIEVFEQASQLLIGLTSDWGRIGRLDRVGRAAFRQLVRPGDQVRALCERQGAVAGEPGRARPSAGPAEAGMGRWVVDAAATVDGRRVATATLEFALEDAAGDREAAEQAARYRELARALQEHPLDLVAGAMALEPGA